MLTAMYTTEHKKSLKSFKLLEFQEEIRIDCFILPGVIPKQSLDIMLAKWMCGSIQKAEISQFL